ncbi:MAG: lamin tail domain-containing protein [Deltaproteobacteria bacterium]|nr:lamin tail domain-containing protein [Deltaproteobacteria bacterium]
MPIRPVFVRLLAALACLTLAAACSDGATPSGSDANIADSSSDTAGDITSSDTTSADTSGGDTSGDSSGGDAASEVNGCAFVPATTASHLVINEIEGKGDDWVELRNNGTTPIDLSGLIVADRDDTGCARLAEALTFPTGASLAAGEHLLIVGGKKTPEVGLQDKCLTTGPATCFQASFKVSAGAGDTIFLISGKTILDSAPLPPGVLSVDTQSWGRVPNGSGPFQLASPTPGAANHP